MYRIVLLAAMFVLGACSQVTPPGAGETTGVQPAASGVRGDGTQVAVSQKLGAVFVVGSTNGALDGPYKGGEDVFLRRHNRDGTLAWRTQIGGAANDRLPSIALDQNSNVYVGTLKTAVGEPTMGSLYKYNSAGKQLWVRRFVAAPENTSVSTLTVAGNGNIYFAGSGLGEVDVKTFLRAYNTNGTFLYETSFLGADMGEDVTALTADAAGNAYMATRVGTDEDYYDAIVYKFSPNGKKLWARGVPGETWIFNLQVVNNTLWAGGTKYYLADVGDGHYHSVEKDAFVVNYNPSGTLMWSKSVGTSQYDNLAGISADLQGNAVVVGSTMGSLGAPNKGQTDIFVRKFTPTGNVIWTKQFGTADYDSGADIVAYGTNEIYLTGYTDGTFANSTYNSGVLTMRLDGSGRTVWLDQ